jgi:hypothetical protein
MKSGYLCLLFLLPVIFCSCRHKAIENKFIPSFVTYTDSVSKEPVVKNEIFYGVTTPVEITAIFERLGVPYSNVTLNPPSNSDMYLSSAKASLNTGIYGVDFGYLKLFGLGQEMMNYGVTIREMSNKLGIPDDYLNSTIQSLQGNMPDPDSILAFMNKAYIDMESHLRKSGRESTAGLMVIGGWIEAMYISTQLVYDPSKPDPQVVQKIAEQKFTLNSLLSFIKNYYDDPVVVYYSKKLKYLNNYFDSFDIYFRKGDLEIDTVKQVFRTSGSEMNVTVETLNKIRDYVAQLRTEIITP